MKYSALILLAFTLLLVLTDASLLDRFTRQTRTTTTVDGSTKCVRQVVTTYTARDIHLESTRACKKDNSKTATRLVFDINTIGRPDIRTAFYEKTTDGNDTDLAWKSFRVYFERVIEYSERNGVPGYQPGPLATDDKPNSIDFLSRLTWTPFQYTKESLTSGGTIHTFTTASTDGLVELGFHFTTDYVTGTNHTSFVPHSGKFSFAVNNYTYSNPNSTGLAFRIFVIGRGGVRDLVSGDTSTQLDLTGQSGVNVAFNGDFGNSFFTWNDFVSDLNNSGSPLTLYNKILNIDSDLTDLNGVVTDRTLHATTIWFSLPGRPTAIEWDPQIGIADSMSSATSIFTSLLLLFACVYAFL